MTQTLSIGDLGRRTSCKVQTIRWYEEVGLLPHPARTEGGHRVYGNEHLARLDFIRHARELGFPLEAVRALLALSDRPDRPCEEAHALASAQLALVEQKLRRLDALRTELTRMTDACSGGVAAECRILETLADHSHGHCTSPHHGGLDNGRLNHGDLNHGDLNPGDLNPGDLNHGTGDAIRSRPGTRGPG